jgi:osmotically-inducible protein OsmY
MKVHAWLVPLIYVLNAFTAAAGAQNAPVSPLTAGAQSAADEDLRNRVATALRSDPYFYDAHVTVTVEKGAVVLRGFVFSEWDLRDAIRIARTAAGDIRVVDSLSIVQGGRR